MWLSVSNKYPPIYCLTPLLCQLTQLVSCSLTLNTEISRTLGYKSASRCSKNYLLLIRYFKFWNPLVFSKPTVFSWNINSKVLQARALHVTLTLWRPATFGDFWKNTKTHVALRQNFSRSVSAMDLVEASKHTASLLVCTQKIFLLGGAGFLWVTS